MWQAQGGGSKHVHCVSATMAEDQIRYGSSFWIPGPRNHKYPEEHTENVLGRRRRKMTTAEMKGTVREEWVSLNNKHVGEERDEGGVRR